MSEPTTVFPTLSPSYILTFQFSSWYPTFANHSIKSTIIRPLSDNFRDYLNADGVFIPEGSENASVESTLSDNEIESTDDEDEEPPQKRYAFPELDKLIRECVLEYDAVFPKLNFSCPKDASWLLPPSSPLKCISPADVYLLLKSSDFIIHDLNPETVFEGCHLDGGSSSSLPPYDLELVLRKWYPVDRSRELRCFVRGNLLIAISQRDTNFYEFWNNPNTQTKVSTAIQDFWRTNIFAKWTFSEDCKEILLTFFQSFLDTLTKVGFPPLDIFDFLLTRDLSKGHILDFNPYAPKTDPLLFTYEELRDLIRPGTHLPVLRVINSPLHPAAAANAPAHQHNMIPFEAVSMSNGLNIEEFADLWKDSLKESMKDTA